MPGGQPLRVAVSQALAGTLSVGKAGSLRKGLYNPRLAPSAQEALVSRPGAPLGAKCACGAGAFLRAFPACPPFGPISGPPILGLIPDFPILGFCPNSGLFSPILGFFNSGP